MFIKCEVFEDFVAGLENKKLELITLLIIIFR